MAFTIKKKLIIFKEKRISKLQVSLLVSAVCEVNDLMRCKTERCSNAIAHSKRMILSITDN